jgi:hypothetical protein
MEGTLSGPPATVSTAELAAQITELAGHLNAANRRWLALIAEFDRRRGWSDSLTRSCAHWLNWQCGIDMGAAREKVRVAHALEQLPLIGAAMARGELSYSKVRALTRVAGPATEQVFLSIALHGTAHHVETIVRQYRRATEAAELSREAQQQAGHHVRHWADGGETKLSNLVSLCRFHHRQVHEGRIRVERLDDGAWRFVKPGGEAFVSAAPQRTWPLALPPRADCSDTTLIAANRAHGLEIDSRTAATRWRGEVPSTSARSRTASAVTPRLPLMNSLSLALVQPISRAGVESPPSALQCLQAIAGRHPEVRKLSRVVQ